MRMDWSEENPHGYNESIDQKSTQYEHYYFHTPWNVSGEFESGVHHDQMHK